MNSITQDRKFRRSLMRCAEKFGIARTSRKYNRSKTYICFWKARFDGSTESPACRPRRPHSRHPKQHTEAELKLYPYTAVDEYSRCRILGAYTKASTFSSADFLRRVVDTFRRKGVKVECVRTDKNRYPSIIYTENGRDIFSVKAILRV